MSTLYANDIETSLVKRCILSGDVVFDVGASDGCWSELALLQQPSKLHLFEPIQECFKEVVEKFHMQIQQGIVTVVNCALFSYSGNQNFYYYPKNPTLSTIFRRVSVEETLEIEPVGPIQIQVVSLDEYCREYNIDKIDFLKIDVEGAEFDVILGAKNLLKNSKIKFIEFEYGGTYKDSGKTLRQVYEFLTGFKYKVSKASPNGVEEILEFRPEHEDFDFSIFLAELQTKG